MAQQSFSTDRRLILTRGKPAPGSQIFLPWGDALQVETVSGVDAGSIWRPNQQLAKRTRGETTHQRYSDVYKLLRAGLHIRDQYGIRHPDEASERGVVTADIEDARLLAQAILGLRVTSESDASLSAALNVRLAEKYASKVDENKATSGQRFARALHAFDDYLRHTGVVETNPVPERKLTRSQAAMVVGSGIHYLQRRLEVMESIAGWLEYRTGKIYALIGRTMTVYRELWGVLAKPEFHLVSTERRLELSKYLRGFVNSARTMRFRPFRNNAFRAGQDAELILEALILGDDKTALEGLRRLRRGIRWIFMLNAVQCEIAIPLSLRLERRSRAHRVPAEKSVMFPEVEQEKLVGAIRGLPGRLRTLSDEGLQTPVKTAVLAQVDQAIEFANASDWRSCLTELDALMQILLSAYKRLALHRMVQGFFVLQQFG